MKNELGWLLLAAAMIGGCSDDVDATEAAAEEDPGEHACEHVAQAGSSLQAAADPADAPELALGEEPVTVALPEEGAGFHGYVKLRGPVDALLFSTEEAVVSSLTRVGASSDLLPEAAPNELCGDTVPEHFDLELEDADYILELGPASVEHVWLMFLDASGHAHSE
jgi:hypothetical protein